MVQKALVYTSLDSSAVTRHVLSVEDQEWVRSNLEVRGLIAFVPDGAVLPRMSGADDKPMVDNKGEDSDAPKLVRFNSPDSLRVSFDLPNMGKTLAGIGIRKGITLIVGGGFHGKSTLLSALQVGMYNKIPGDGREFCVCTPNAVKIRAEDGRSVSQVNISPFINNLPFGQGTTNFTTADASGSTSQATNIMEVRIAKVVIMLYAIPDVCLTFLQTYLMLYCCTALRRLKWAQRLYSSMKIPGKSYQSCNFVILYRCMLPHHFTSIFQRHKLYDPR